MKRIIIVHRWEGSSQDDWRLWLKDELKRLGYEVIVPDMPDTDVPVIEKWVNKLSEVVGVLDEDVYFIGHSIGCQTILRYLETIETPVGGALFVAGWFNLENLEDDDVKEIAKPWIETPINIEKIKKVLPKSTLLISKDDPYGAFDENVAKFSTLLSKVCVYEHAGHFTNSIEPEILKQFKNFIEK